MKPDQFFPAVGILINIGAVAFCFAQGDWKKALYWVAAAWLTFDVTFLMKWGDMKKVPQKIYLFKYRYGNTYDWEFSLRTRTDNICHNWHDVTYIEIEVSQINTPVHKEFFWNSLHFCFFWLFYCHANDGLHSFFQEINARGYSALALPVPSHRRGAFFN